MSQLFLRIIAQAYGEGSYSLGDYGVGELPDTSPLPNTGGEIWLTIVTFSAILLSLYLFRRLRNAQQ